VRGSIELVKQFAALNQEAEDTGRSVATDLKKLSQKYKGAGGSGGPGRAAVGAREVAVSAANALFLTDPLFKNIPKVKSNCDLWKNKLSGLRTKSHDLAGKINPAIAECAKLEAALRAVPRHPKNVNKIAKGLDALTGIRSKLNELLTKIPDIHGRVERGNEAQAACAQALQQLALKSPAWTATFDKVFPILVNLGLAAAGDVMGVQQAVTGTMQGVTNIGDYVSTSLGVVNDLASTTYDVTDAVG
jgi:hypothetical protein